MGSLLPWALLLVGTCWALLGGTWGSAVPSAVPSASQVQADASRLPDPDGDLRRVVLEQQSLLLALQSSVLHLQSLVFQHIFSGPQPGPDSSSAAAPCSSAGPSPTAAPAAAAAPSGTHPPRSTGSGGATYIRWGRTSCPRDNELVYKGYVGGSHYTHKGAAADYLCLPEDPQYANFTDGKNDDSGLVYGGEYETGRLPNFSNNQQDAPCAVCRSPTRTTALMIPARTSCYPGYHLEYLGYLISGYYDSAAASQYICVDHQPENVAGGHANQNGKLLYFVEGRCGSLHCPPYVEGRELPCVVCSK